MQENKKTVLRAAYSNKYIFNILVFSGILGDC